MCLNLNKNSKVLTARTNITVYKNVRKHAHNATKTFHALYFNQEYVLGKVVKVSAFNPYRSSGMSAWDFVDTLPENHTGIINKGLHSASKKSRAQLYGGDVTLECIIPKGTKYIRGTNNEVVSLSLKPIRVVSQ